MNTYDAERQAAHKNQQKYTFCWYNLDKRRVILMYILPFNAKKSFNIRSSIFSMLCFVSVQHPKLNIQHVLFCQCSTPEAQYSACLVLSAFNTRSSIFSMFCFVSIQHPKFNIQFAKFIFHTTMFNIDI